jgi:hypothetical protein
MQVPIIGSRASRHRFQPGDVRHATLPFSINGITVFIVEAIHTATGSRVTAPPVPTEAIGLELCYAALRGLADAHDTLTGDKPAESPLLTS